MQTLIYSCTHVNTCTCKHILIITHKYTHTKTYANTYTYKQMHTNTCTHSYSYTFKYIHMQTHARANIWTHKHIHTYTCFRLLKILYTFEDINACTPALNHAKFSVNCANQSRSISRTFKRP